MDLEDTIITGVVVFFIGMLFGAFIAITEGTAGDEFADDWCTETYGDGYGMVRYDRLEGEITCEYFPYNHKIRNSSTPFTTGVA